MKNVVFFIFLFVSFNTKSEVISKIIVNSNVYYGDFFPSSEYQGINRRDINGFNLNFSIKEDTNKLWSRFYNYPEFGYGFSFFNFGNQKVLGYSFNFYRFTLIPILSHRNFSLNFLLSPGISFLTKTYDSLTNKNNKFIGSNINFYLQTGLVFNYKISRNFKINLELDFNHFSNGRIKSPNNGLNYIAFGAGLKYSFSEDNERKYNFTINDFKPFGGFLLFYSVGFKQFKIGESESVVHIVNFDYERRYTFSRSCGFGLDCFYDSSISKDYFSEKSYNPFFDIFQLGAHLSYNFLYDKSALSFQFGRYIYTKISPSSMYYSQIAYKYNFYDNFHARIVVKSHKMYSDYIEWGLGYKF